MGNTTTQYMYEGSLLVAEKIGNTLIQFLYDASGSPVAMIYDGTTYVYEKNLQGDIIGLYTEAGVKIASYSYDAWGNTISQSYESGYYNPYYYNPFRYRGYYYDTETGFYYLQSRYYDPATGRFINADGYVNANGDLTGYNMYAYCSNNPVMNVDPTGCELISAIICTVVLISLVALVISDIVNLTESDSNIIAKTTDEGIQIENSYKIKTSVVQYGYLVYLKYFCSKTDGKIKGSVSGAQYEWQLHNYAYYAGSLFNIESFTRRSKDVDIGKTIFSDRHENFEGVLSTTMKVTYISRGALFLLVDLLIEELSA